MGGELGTEGGERGVFRRHSRQLPALSIFENAPPSGQQCSGGKLPEQGPQWAATHCSEHHGGVAPCQSRPQADGQADEQQVEEGGGEHVGHGLGVAQRRAHAWRSGESREAELPGGGASWGVNWAGVAGGVPCAIPAPMRQHRRFFACMARVSPAEHS